MAKQQIRQKETEVSTQDGVGKQLERTLTVDDSSLPSPQELAAYKEVDPNIVTFLMESASLEQKHRHNIDKSKIDIIKKSETRISRTNWWGMFFAFLSIVVLVLLCGYALYLNRPWFAGFLGAGTIVAVGSIFVNRKSENKRR